MNGASDTQAGRCRQAQTHRGAGTSSGASVTKYGPEFQIRNGGLREKSAGDERESADDKNGAHGKYDQNRPVQEPCTRLNRGLDDVTAFFMHNRLRNGLSHL
jgi:hypothetical protein